MPTRAFTVSIGRPARDRQGRALEALCPNVVKSAAIRAALSHSGTILIDSPGGLAAPDREALRLIDAAA